MCIYIVIWYILVGEFRCWRLPFGERYQTTTDPMVSCNETVYKESERSISYDHVTVTSGGSS